MDFFASSGKLFSSFIASPKLFNFKLFSVLERMASILSPEIGFKERVVICVLKNTMTFCDNLFLSFFEWIFFNALLASLGKLSRSFSKVFTPMNAFSRMSSGKIIFNSVAMLESETPKGFP